MAVLVFVLAGAPAASAAGPPSVSISPANALPGTTIMVDGTGFAHSTAVTFTLDDAAIATNPSTVETDPSGNFQQVFITVPSREAPGSHTLKANGVAAQEPLTVPAPLPLTAAFTPDSATALAGATIQFDGTPSGDPDDTITGYSWNFGDGSTASGARPTHAYATPGTYTASLTVTDNAGNRGTVSHQVTVIGSPPVQTLIETIAPAPSVIKSGAPPSLTRSGTFDLGERIFCPGTGPSCSSSVTVTKGLNSQLRRRLRRAGTSAIVAATTLATPADRSTEIVVKLSRQAIKSYRAHRHLPLTVVIVSHRGGETLVTKLNVMIRRTAK